MKLSIVRLPESQFIGMAGIVTSPHQPMGENRRELNINQESHAATGTMAWSACRAAYANEAGISSGSRNG